MSAAYAYGEHKVEVSLEDVALDDLLEGLPVGEVVDELDRQEVLDHLDITVKEVIKLTDEEMLLDAIGSAKAEGYFDLVPAT